MGERDNCISAIIECLRIRGVSCEIIETQSDNNYFRATTEIRARYEMERQMLQGEGYTPLLIFPDNALACRLIESTLPRFAVPLEQDIQKVKIVEPKLMERIETYKQDARIIDGKALILMLLEDVKEGIAALRLHWAHLIEADPNAPFLDFFVHGPVLLAKIPTEKAWEIPAYISSDNDSFQKPSWEIAVFRYWHDMHAAVPMALSSSSWHLHVGKPVVDVQEAIKLMLEQIAFCPHLLEFSNRSEFRNGWALNAPRWGFWRPVEGGKEPQLPSSRKSLRTQIKEDEVKDQS